MKVWIIGIAFVITTWGALAIEGVLAHRDIVHNRADELTAKKYADQFTVLYLLGVFLFAMALALFIWLLLTVDSI